MNISTATLGGLLRLARDNPSRSSGLSLVSLPRVAFPEDPQPRRSANAARSCRRLALSEVPARPVCGDRSTPSCPLAGSSPGVRGPCVRRAQSAEQATRLHPRSTEVRAPASRSLRAGETFKRMMLKNAATPSGAHDIPAQEAL